jgi:hypothetical protein
MKKERKKNMVQLKRYNFYFFSTSIFLSKSCSTKAIPLLIIVAIVLFAHGPKLLAAGVVVGGQANLMELRQLT